MPLRANSPPEALVWTRVTKCDLIVCWEHNWPECPLEVIELKSLVGQYFTADHLTADQRG